MARRDIALLDTHSLVWWKAGGSKLSARAARTISQVDSVLISPITIWEVGMLAEKGRIKIDRDLFDWTLDLFDTDRLEPAPLSPQAAIFASKMPARGFGGDPADALIYATAHDLSAPLVTRDSGIRTFAAAHKEIGTIW